jgi:1-aminocyclopropane-1-carboxylate deaminase/D-cysteine desulfhydrase-like pyridoxal-dependent ACC family enzyme
MAALATATARLLDVAAQFSAEDVDNVDDYVGREYGIPTPASIEAIRLLGRTEGILLDPIYSGRAMAGLIDRVRQGKVGKDETVVFVHTGGVPALFAYNEELTA